MKALFVHDHTFARSADGEIYSPGKLPYAAWQRYLAVFPQLTVLSRVVDRSRIPPGHRLEIATGPGVEIHAAATNPFDRRRQVRELVHQADAVIARLPSRLGVVAGKAALQRGVPLAVEVVGCARDAYWYHGRALAKAYAPIAWWNTRAVVSKADFALYVTDAYLQRMYPTTGQVGVASNVVIPSPTSDVLDARLERAAQPVTSLGMIGGLDVKYKGWAVAIRALRRLRVDYPDLELRILGDGDPDRWRRLADQVDVGDAVHFDGVIPSGSPVYDWLDQRDVYILPTRTEGLPRSLLEAMSRGLPAVASGVSDIPSLLDPRFLHAPGSPLALSRTLRPLLDSPQLRSEAARQNHSRVAAFAFPILEDRRASFWSAFAEFVTEGRES